MGQFRRASLFDSNGNRVATADRVSPDGTITFTLERAATVKRMTVYTRGSKFPVSITPNVTALTSDTVTIDWFSVVTPACELP